MKLLFPKAWCFRLVVFVAEGGVAVTPAWVRMVPSGRLSLHSQGQQSRAAGGGVGYYAATEP